MGEPNGSAERITLSRETLRAELAQMELRLVDRITLALATKADMGIVDQLDKRVQDLEISRASREHLERDFHELEKRVTFNEQSKADKDEVEGLTRFRYAFPSATVVSSLAALALALYTTLH